MTGESKVVRIAAVGDLHYTKTSKGALQPLFAEASKAADVLLLCGDLTDYGTLEEAKALAEDIRAFATIPVLAVLGNHDCESGHMEEVSNILENQGVKMIEGECTEIKGIGFAGVCGFGGGFGKYMLNAWGESLVKAFAHEAVEHAMRLERALARLQTPKRVVMMHYAPLRETVEGESPEVMAFLGSSRLEGPLNRFNVSVAFHGHAHNGALEARTSGGVPVYNVSLPLLKRLLPNQPWFRVVELAP
jgi:Icc-related predicted phosphoesterase